MSEPPAPAAAFLSRMLSSLTALQFSTVTNVVAGTGMAVTTWLLAAAAAVAGGPIRGLQTKKPYIMADHTQTEIELSPT